MGVDLKLKIYFFTLGELGLQCLTMADIILFRNQGQLLWFKSSRIESNDVLNEYGGYLLLFLVIVIEIFNLQAMQCFSRWLKLQLNLADIFAFAHIKDA